MKDSVAGIDYRFSDRRLLEEALTHRSIGAGNYERLEFLGDSVLSMVISSRLFELHPEASEGDLTKMRARLVRGATLAELAGAIELGRAVMMDSAMMKSGGFRNTSILADTFEAMLGAIYLDGGLEDCREVILTQFEPLIEAMPAVEQLKDPKTKLQEWLQARGRPLPVYALEFEEGAAHAKTFYVSCVLDDGTRAEAEGSSRSAAEQSAAARLLDGFREQGE